MVGLDVLVSLLCLLTPSIGSPSPYHEVQTRQLLGAYDNSTGTNETMNFNESSTTTASWEPEVSCYNTPSDLPPDFHCHSALQVFIDKLHSSFPDRHKTVLVSRIPNPFTSYALRVPKTYVSGSCIFRIDLKLSTSAMRVNSLNLGTWGRKLVGECVQDEGDSGGGTLTVLSDMKLPARNELTYEMKVKRDSVENWEDVASS